MQLRSRHPFQLVGTAKVKTVEMKANYRDARFAHALLLIDVGQNQKAIEELTYILEHLDPTDELVRLQLEDLR